MSSEGDRFEEAMKEIAISSAIMSTIACEEALDLTLEPGSFHLGMVAQNLMFRMPDPLALMQENRDAIMAQLKEIRERYVDEKTRPEKDSDAE